MINLYHMISGINLNQLIGFNSQAEIMKRDVHSLKAGPLSYGSFLGGGAERARVHLAGEGDGDRHSQSEGESR